MRVVLTTDTVGGVWTFTRELAMGLLERGHAVALVSLGRKPSLSQRIWATSVKGRYKRAFRYEASETPLEWMEGNVSAYSGAEDLLLRVVDEFEADVLHASQFCFGALPVDVPIVLTAHSDVLSWAEACRPGGMDESSWLRRYRELVSAGIAGANAVVAPTHWMRDVLVRNFPGATGARVILNGRSLPPDELTMDEGVETRLLQAVTMGRAWDEGKGLAVLSDAEVRMPVLIVGETCFEGERAPELRTLKFLGCLGDDEVLDVLRKSSLYLATSIYEPFGLAPLEAALCGCGVVARDIPSLREVWGNGAAYFTDGEGLSRLMSRLCVSPAEVEGLRRRSMSRGLELSPDRMVDAYVSQYQVLLARASANVEVAAYAS